MDWEKVYRGKYERGLHTSRSAIEVTDQVLPFGYDSNSERSVKYVITPYRTHVVFWYMQFNYLSPEVEGILCSRIMLVYTVYNSDGTHCVGLILS